MLSLRIRNLFIYPLKSAAGMRVAEATIDALGFVGDRRWMVVDTDGKFLSQRRIPKMALIQATNVADGGLYLSAPDVGSIHVSQPSEGGVTLAATVWSDTVDALDAGDASAEWLTAVLGESSRLVYCPPSRGRIVDRTYSSGNERVGFADGFPLLVLGHSSVQEINMRLEAHGQARIGVERFRPNIVVEGAEAWAEDLWSSLDVATAEGSLRIDLVKPCARCSIISVDPRTGVQGSEPMRTLTTYRRRDNNVYVAQNGLARGEGRIATGAAVTIAIRQ